MLTIYAETQLVSGIVTVFGLMFEKGDRKDDADRKQNAMYVWRPTAPYCATCLLQSCSFKTKLQQKSRVEILLPFVSVWVTAFRPTVQSTESFPRIVRPPRRKNWTQATQRSTRSSWMRSALSSLLNLALFVSQSVH